MREKKWLVRLGLVVVVFLWVGVAQLGLKEANPPPQLVVLTIGTADSGGTMYPVGRAIAQVVEAGSDSIKVNTGASNGSNANVEGLRSGQIDLGLVSSDVAYCAYQGVDAFAAQPMTELRAIGAMYSSVSNWMVPSSGSAYTVHDLKGQSVALGPEGSATELSASIALEVLGIHEANTRFENYGLGAGGEAMLKGSIDAIHGFAGIPIAALQAAAEKTPCRLLGYTDEELTQILERNPAYVRMTIPANTYPGQTRAVATFGVKCILSVHADMDEALVYAITALLYEAMPQLQQLHPSMAQMSKGSFLYEDLKIPLHPAAQRFYEEKGLLSPRNEA